jgi:hypothetical protein
MGSALYFTDSPSGNSDRAFSIRGKRNSLRLIRVVIRDVHTHDPLVLVAVFAVLTGKTPLVEFDLD